uniref:(northern house mosquito) hypothetical protein n=1 Tax=Culex pipiens TaxID=7175 RepID=A0A8D8MW38_CULPI
MTTMLAAFALKLVEFLHPLVATTHCATLFGVHSVLVVFVVSVFAISVLRTYAVSWRRWRRWWLVVTGSIVGFLVTVASFAGDTLVVLVTAYQQILGTCAYRRFDRIRVLHGRTRLNQISIIWISHRIRRDFSDRQNCQRGH